MAPPKVSVLGMLRKDRSGLLVFFKLINLVKRTLVKEKKAILVVNPQ